MSVTKKEKLTIVEQQDKIRPQIDYILKLANAEPINLPENLKNDDGTANEGSIALAITKTIEEIGKTPYMAAAVIGLDRVEMDGGLSTCAKNRIDEAFEILKIDAKIQHAKKTKDVTASGVLGEEETGINRTCDVITTLVLLDKFPSRKEALFALEAGKIKVNGAVIRDPNFGVVHNDLITFPSKKS